MNIVITASLLAYISQGTPLIPFILGVIYYRTFSSYLKVLFIYICVACSIELLSFYLLHLGFNNNLFLGHVNTVVEFSAFTYMYLYVLKLKGRNFIFPIVTLLFALFVILDVIYIEGHKNVNALSRNTEAIVLIALSIVYFYRLMVRAEHKNLLSIPAFWINAGVIIYFSGGFFLILFSNYMIAEDEVGYQILYMIHSIFNITFNLLIGIGFLKQRNAY